MTEIRLATAREAVAACEVLRRSIACCTEDHRNDPLVLQKWLSNKTPETVESWFCWPAHFPLVATVDENVVGVAMLSRPGKIVLLHVDPAWRGRGIGTALLKAMEEKALRTGSATLRVSSTMSARRFYESQGFEFISNTTVPYGSALAMAKRLKPACAEGAAICGCAATASRTLA